VDHLCNKNLKYFPEVHVWCLFFPISFSDSILELSVMPKDEDILQLVCLWSLYSDSML